MEVRGTSLRCIKLDVPRKSVHPEEGAATSSGSTGVPSTPLIPAEGPARDRHGVGSRTGRRGSCSWIEGPEGPEQPPGKAQQAQTLVSARAELALTSVLAWDQDRWRSMRSGVCTESVRACARVCLLVGSRRDG